MKAYLGRMQKAFCSSLLLSIVFAAHAAPPKVIRSLRFDEKSPYAMVVFEAVPQLQVPKWRLDFLAFSIESRSWTYGPFKGWAGFGQISGGVPAPSFHAALVTPAGSYAINNISVQGFWVACFNGGTRAFNVEAGKVNYIGVVDPNSAIKQIREELPQTTKGQHLVLFDTPRLLHVAPSQHPGWEARLSEFLAQFPKVTAPVVAAEPIDVTFDPTESWAGKLCEKY